MKKQLLMLGMILIPTLAMAATPDFNGSWTRNNASSDPAPNTMYWTTRAAGGGGGFGGGAGRRAPEIVMTVREDAKGMHVSESNAIARDYVLDGKPHTRPTDTGIEKADVTAQLQGDTLVIETKEPYGGMPGNATLTTKQTWALSPDGNTLTVTTTRDVAARHQTYKQVYTRTQTQPGAICSAGCVVPR